MRDDSRELGRGYRLWAIRLVATDKDVDANEEPTVLTYSLGGRDAASFTIDQDDPVHRLH